MLMAYMLSLFKGVCILNRKISLMLGIVLLLLSGCKESKASSLPDIEIVSNGSTSRVGSELSTESVVSSIIGEVIVDTNDTVSMIEESVSDSISSNEIHEELDDNIVFDDELGYFNSITPEDEVIYSVYSGMIKDNIDVSIKVKRVYRESNFKDFVFVNNMVADCNEVSDGIIDPNKMKGIEFAVAEINLNIVPDENPWITKSSRGYPFPDRIKTVMLSEGTSKSFSKKVYTYERWVETHSQGEMMTTYLIYKIPEGVTDYCFEIETEGNGKQYLRVEGSYE